MKSQTPGTLISHREASRGFVVPPATSTSDQQPAAVPLEPDLEPCGQAPVVCLLVLELHVAEVRPVERRHVVLRHQADAQLADLPVEARTEIERGIRRAARRDVVVVARVTDGASAGLNEWRDPARG